MERVRAEFALLLAACLVALPACGTEDVSPADVADAAEATTDARTARMHIDMEVPDPVGDTVRMEGEGVTDMAAQRGKLTFDLSQIPGGRGELETVFEGFVVWMRTPALEAELPDGAEWIRLDLQEASDSVGIDLGQFGQTGNDPTRHLDYLRAVGDVEKEGEEEIRGVETTHYRAISDLREYPKLVPRSERESARENVEAMIEFFDDAEMPVEVWIDDDGLVRRMRMPVPTGQPNEETTEAQMEYELYDFGADVDVEPPADEDVVDFTHLAAEGIRRQRR